MKHLRDYWLLAAAALWMFIGAVALLLLVVLGSGCKAMQYGKAGIVPEIIHAQQPGVASGAGGSITGPANSAAPTTQVAERKAWYFPAGPFRYGKPSNAATPPVILDGAPAAPAPEAAPESQPSATYERVETTIGQHQSAIGIVKAAAAMESWSVFKWLSLAAVVVGVLGMAHSYNNDKDGYMMVWMKVTAIGVFCLLVADNPFWLLLLVIPAGFYALQKFNLFRIP